MSGPTIDDMKLDTLPSIRDARGVLTVAEFSKFIPFTVVRLFYVREVPPGTIRGQHAHYRCSQYLVCISGRLRVTFADDAKERSFELSPGHGVLVEPGIFAIETYLDEDSVMLVLCDRPYEKDDYIHTRQEFLEYRHRREGA
jgi:UDP-2-acetamido-3-amino-2,3-dideoxy-glucuronate N-acetyltransferase